jgi:hypothetical protein
MRRFEVPVTEVDVVARSEPSVSLHLLIDQAIGTKKSRSVFGQDRSILPKKERLTRMRGCVRECTAIELTKG